MYEECKRRDRHSPKIDQNRLGTLRGADVKLRIGVILPSAHEEISAIVTSAELADFHPLLYVIPYGLVTATLKQVPIKDRAHPLSQEYILENLPRASFDVLVEHHMTLRTLLSDHTRDIAIEASYYAVRELKQSSVPKDVRKEHFTDASESEPTAEAQTLAADIIKHIEATEHRTIDELSDERRRRYITHLFDIAEAFTATMLRGKPELGTQLLEQLRRG